MHCDSIHEDLLNDPLAMCIMRYLVDHGRMATVGDMTTGVRKVMQKMGPIDREYWDDYHATIAGLIMFGYVYLRPRTGYVVLTIRRGWQGGTEGAMPTGRANGRRSRKPPTIAVRKSAPHPRGDRRRVG